MVPDDSWKMVTDDAERVQAVVDEDSEFREWKQKVQRDVFGAGLPGVVLILTSLAATVAALWVYYLLVLSAMADGAEIRSGGPGIGRLIAAAPFVAVGWGTFHLMAPLIFRWETSRSRSDETSL